MARVTTRISGTPAFIADPESVRRSTGRQIDWANVSATNSDGKKIVPAGTVVGELLGGGKVSPRVVTTNPAVGVMETTAVEGEREAALSGYGVILGAHLYENLLPGATGGPPATLASAIKTELRAAGGSWTFETYADDRAA
jgi:hypothetical protein